MKFRAIGITDTQIEQLVRNWGDNASVWQLERNITNANLGVFGKDFASDLANSTTLCQAFKKTEFDAGAWKALKDRPDLKKDIPTLSAMSKLLKNPKAITVFGGDEALQTAMKKFSDTHASSKWSWNKSSMEFHLTLLTKHIDEFQGVDGFDKSIKDAINNGNEHVQDGFWHGMKATEAMGYKRADVKKFDMEFDELLDCGTATNPAGCKFDLELNGSDPKYVEFKSYGDPSQIPDKQFMAYLTRLNSLSEMKYIFNKTKLTVSRLDAKTQMKAFLKTNAEVIFNIGSPKGFFNGITLNDGSKINVTSYQQLKGLCDDPTFSSSSLFDFVTSI